MHTEKLPDCLCGNGEKALYVCVSESCEHLMSLPSRKSKERYYCEECMGKYHDHRPTQIIRKTQEIDQKWHLLDNSLTNIETQFNQNIQEYFVLVTHYEEFAESHKLDKKQGVLSQLRELDEVKQEFNNEVKEKDGDCIQELVGKFMIIELLEDKEPIRIALEKKINSLSKLAVIDEKVFGAIYKEEIEKGGHESVEDLYKEPHTKQLNRDMYLRLKLQSINDLRKQDSEKIKSLESQVQEIFQRISKLEGKK